MKWIRSIIVIISAASAWIFNKIGILYPALVILFFSMCLDYITGMLASRWEAINYPEKQYGINSKKGMLGILKKVSYLLAILLTIMIDYTIIHLGAILGIDFSGNSYFSLLITIWFFINEWVSIVENLGRMGVLLPDWLVKVIMELKERSDNNG